jgi:flagellar transcriptional activator FlhC
VQRAVALIRFGARLQVLEGEINLSRERLLRLYREVAGKSPAKGMLPFSTDWFTTWQPSIHSALFFNMYRAVRQVSGIERVDALIRAYGLYREHLALSGLPEVLSITRAWRLVKFEESGLLETAACTECRGVFLLQQYDLKRNFVCGLCDMPARAGKTRAAAAVAKAEAVESNEAVA